MSFPSSEHIAGSVMDEVLKSLEDADLNPVELERLERAVNSLMTYNLKLAKGDLDALERSRLEGLRSACEGTIKTMAVIGGMRVASAMEAVLKNVGEGLLNIGGELAEKALKIAAKSLLGSIGA